MLWGVKYTDLLFPANITVRLLAVCDQAGSSEFRLRPGCSFCRTLPCFAAVTDLSSVASDATGELIIRWSQKGQTVAALFKSPEVMIMKNSGFVARE
jgi:hypothetical protein